MSYSNYYFPKSSGRVTQVYYARGATDGGAWDAYNAGISGDYTWAQILADQATKYLVITSDPVGNEIHPIFDTHSPAGLRLCVAYPAESTAEIPISNLSGMLASDWFTAGSATGADLRNTKTVGDVAGSLNASGSTIAASFVRVGSC